MKRLLFGLLLLTGANPTAACEPSGSTMVQNVRALLCPAMDHTIRRITVMYRQSGEPHPDLLILTQILNGIEIQTTAGKTVDPRLISRMAGLLSSNPDLRTSLRAALVEASFLPEEVAAWCDADAPGPQRTDSDAEVIARVDEAVSCALS